MDPPFNEQEYPWKQINWRRQFSKQSLKCLLCPSHISSATPFSMRDSCILLNCCCHFTIKGTFSVFLQLHWGHVPRSFLQCNHRSDQPHLTRKVTTTLHTHLLIQRNWEAFVSAKLDDRLEAVIQQISESLKILFGELGTLPGTRRRIEQNETTVSSVCVLYRVCVFVRPFHRSVCFVFLSFMMFSFSFPFGFYSMEDNTTVISSYYIYIYICLRYSQLGLTERLDLGKWSR